MYVDLNPIRAARTDSPEHSPHTSAFDRIGSLKGEQIESAATDLRVRAGWALAIRLERSQTLISQPRFIGGSAIASVHFNCDLLESPLFIQILRDGLCLVETQRAVED